MNCAKCKRLKREKQTYRSCNQEKEDQKEAMRLHVFESKAWVSEDGDDSNEGDFVMVYIQEKSEWNAFAMVING